MASRQGVGNRESGVGSREQGGFEGGFREASGIRMVGSWNSKGVVNGDPGKDGLSSEPKRIWGNRLVGCMIYENSITCLCSHAHL